MMQNKIKRIIWIAVFSALVPLLALSPVVMSQKNLPLALQQTSTLSPVGEYNTVAESYKNDGRKIEDRNRLIFMAIAQIDLNFGSYVKTKRHRNAFFQTVLDILEVGAATAISISNGERGKSIIADALGFIQGSRAKVNRNLRLLEQQVLVNKMIEKRALALADIYGKINQSDAQYPFERAYIDVLAYYEAGTTDAALSSLATDSGTSATTAQKQLNDAKIAAKIVVAPSAVQVKISRDNSAFVQKFIDSEAAEKAKVTAADVAIAAAEATIAAENAKVAPAVPDAAVIAAATATKAAETGKKAAATAAQTAALDKLKTIFTSIEQDSVLEPLLAKLPEKYPNLPIQARLDSIRNKRGTIDDYGSVILKFFGLVKDAVIDNPTVVDRATNIIESVK